MSRLTSLEGRIGGTEDQLNIEMDHRYAVLGLFISELGNYISSHWSRGFYTTLIVFVLPSNGSSIAGRRPDV